MTKVFLSSVSRGMEEVREQVWLALEQAGFSVVGMEAFAARSLPSLAVCLAELRKADVVVATVGPRYGSLTPAGDVSYTHEEFREAMRRGIPVLAFVLPPAEECDENERHRLNALQLEVGESLTYQQTSPAELPVCILASVIRAQREGNISHFPSA